MPLPRSPSPATTLASRLAAGQRHDQPGRHDVSGEPYVGLARETAAVLAREWWLRSSSGDVEEIREEQRFEPSPRRRRLRCQNDVRSCR